MSNRMVLRIASFGLGIVVGTVFSYYLYRIGLPIQPFIYQAF